MCTTRLFLLSLCFFSALLCSGQEKSRIVFFRMDAPVGKSASALSEWRAYTDKLTKDGATIATMRSTAVFIYTGTNPEGVYALPPAVSGQAYSNRLNIRPLNGGIAFVKISLSGSTPITARLEMVSLKDFEQCFAATKWLRSRLDDAGYATVEELIKGFRVMAIDTIVGPDERLIPQRRLGDTIFFDGNKMVRSREEAGYFSTSEKEAAGGFLIKSYYLPEGTIRSISHWQTLDSESREGHSQRYFRNGQLSARGNYKNNRMDGLWENFYDTPANRLWYTCPYKMNKMVGMLKSYYRDGRIKREEEHQLFADTLFVQRRGKKDRYIQEKDSIVRGHRYDTAGREIPFTRFEVMPKAAYDLNAFLSKNLRYPKSAREHATEGRVVVQFTVTRDGFIEDAFVVRHVSEDIDQEALRVLGLMPRWEAGLQDDRPVDVVFTLPFTFRLD